MTPKPQPLESWNFERMFTPHSLSHFMFHVSCVLCHVSRVTCHIFFFNFFFFWQSGGVSWWRVCYQRGLPRLVSSQIRIKLHLYLRAESWLDNVAFYCHFLLIETGSMKVCSVRCALRTMYTSHCTLCTMYTSNCTLCTVFSERCTLYIVYTSYYTLAQCTVWGIHCVQCTM